MEGVKVKLEESGFETKLTESDGYYEFTPVIPGVYTLQVQEVNHCLTEYKRVSIGEEENKEVNIALEECGQIQFEVVDDETGEPIPVYEVKRIWNHMHLPLFPVKDHGNGKITFSGLRLSGGNYLYLYASGYGQHTGDYVVSNDKETESHTIRLKKRVLKRIALKGHVFDENRSPLEGAIVSHSPKMSAKTKPDGSYLLVLDEYYSVSKLFVSKSGYATAWFEDLVFGDISDPGIQDFTLSPGNWLELSIKDEVGNPIENVTINLHQSSKYNSTRIIPPRCYEKITPQFENKTFRFESLPDNVEKVYITSKDYSNFQKKMELNSYHKVVLKTMGVILGEVVDAETGDPIEDFKVKITGGGGIDMRRFTFGESFSDPDGLFLLKDLNQGRDYTVTIETNWYTAKTVEKTPAIGPNDDTIVTIELEKSKSQCIQIVDDQTSEPLAEVAVGTVSITPYGRQHLVWDSFCQENKVFSSDNKGIVNIPDPTENTFLVIFPYRHYARQALAYRDLEQDDGKIYIKLKPGSTINGRFGKLSPESVTASHSSQGLQFDECRRGIAIDQQGNFSLSNLSPGQYSISPRLHSDRMVVSYYSKTVVVNEYGETINIALDDNLGSTRLSGILTLDDQPVKGEDIMIQAGFSTGNIRWFSCITKQGGAYEFPHLENGEYKLSVHISRSVRSPTLYRNVTVSGDTEYHFKILSGHEVSLSFSLPEIYLEDDYNVQRVSVTSVSGAPNTLYFKKEGSVWKTKGDINGIYHLRVSLSTGKESKTISIPGEFTIDSSKEPVDLGVIDVPDE